eukprot:717995-Prymnesium_polylepis.1
MRFPRMRPVSRAYGRLRRTRGHNPTRDGVRTVNRCTREFPVVKSGVWVKAPAGSGAVPRSGCGAEPREEILAISRPKTTHS